MTLLLEGCSLSPNEDSSVNKLLNYKKNNESNTKEIRILKKLIPLYPRESKQMSAVLFLVPACFSFRKDKRPLTITLLLITLSSLVVHSKEYGKSIYWNVFDKFMILVWLFFNIRRAIGLKAFEKIIKNQSFKIQLAAVCCAGVFICNHIRTRVSDQYAVRVHQAMHTCGAVGTMLLLLQNGDGRRVKV